MDWNASTLWWVATGALVLAELATGTFYLLMLALGAAAAALAAMAGGGFTAQLLAAAGVGGGAVVVWHRRRASGTHDTDDTASNRNVNLDVGERVQVAAWGSDGRAQVQYRGSNWAAVFRGIGAPAPGEYVIVAVESNHLVLAPHAG